ncbi:MAG: SRPBCC family protein [Deltaproteobacteria bacterium]|nr:SRPBCC family protein [Deltaproteobacteria bacterium]MBW2401039.1 SRPBCC family protein [Deltaproteobacteria bacterium]
MAIEIKETLQVEAPIERVWDFVIDPQRVVTCMPGAALDEIVDDKTFLGTVKVKLGAITTKYKGRVEYAEVDAQAHSIQMVAEGRETGGGTAKGTIAMRVNALPEGSVELVIEAGIDLTGRVMQVGRGMIQGVSHQLFKQFAASAKEILEAEDEAAEEAAVAAVAEQKPVAIVPLLFRTIVEAIVNFFKRLFGGSRD